MKGNYPKIIIVIIYIYVPLSFQGSLQANRNINHYFGMVKSLNTSCDYQSKAKLDMLRYLEIPKLYMYGLNKKILVSLTTFPNHKV